MNVIQLFEAALAILAFAMAPGSVEGLSCNCGIYACQTPICCKGGGSYVKDVCGCCQTCSKEEGEECNGPFGALGRCGLGLACRTDCSGSGEDKCETDGNLFNKAGKCVNHEKIEEEIITTTYKLVPGVDIDDVEFGPLCENTPKPKRCRCSIGGLLPPGAITKSPGEDCNPYFGAPKDLGEFGWCFLENLQDPLDPKQDCFSDVEWSKAHGRYYSLQACDPANRIDGFTGAGGPAHAPPPPLRSPPRAPLLSLDSRRER